MNDILVIPTDVPQTPELHVDGELFLVTNGEGYVCTFITNKYRGIGCLMLAFADRGLAINCADKIGEGSIVIMKDQLDVGSIALSRKYGGYSIITADDIKHIWL